jgi:hypothetical protein
VRKKITKGNKNFLWQVAQKIYVVGNTNFFGGHPNLLVSDNNNEITNKLMIKMTKTKMRW